MPHPSGPNAYPSAPFDYPSGPDAWQGTAAGTVASSGVVGEIVIGGGDATGAAISGGTANLILVAFAAASGEVTASAPPLTDTVFAAAASIVTASGDATATQTCTGAAAGAVVSSASTAAASIPGPRGTATSVGTATANQEFASTAAAGTVTSNGEATGGFRLAATALGVGPTGTGTARVTVDETAAAHATTFATAAADGARVVDAAAAAETASSGAAASLVELVANVAATAASSADVTVYAWLYTAARGTVDARAEEGASRTARGAGTSNGAADATPGFTVAAHATAHAGAVADGARIIDAAAEGTVIATGAAGAVIAWQHAAAGIVTSSANVTFRVFHPILAVPPGPVKPQVLVPRTRLLVVDTVTGRVVYELPYGDLQWATPLNKETTCSTTLIVEAAIESVYAQGAADPRNALREVLTGPYRFALVVCYGNTAVQGGPLLPTDDENDGTVTAGAVGMERMLDRRLLINRHLSITDPLPAATRDITINNTTPANAILAVVTEATTTYDPARPRTLPITCLDPPSPKGYENFTWLAYDAKTVWGAVSDIVGRADGPDVRLEPYLWEGPDGMYVSWDLQIGDPTFDVPPGNYGPSGPLPWTWDDTVCAITRSVDAAGLATDYVSTGNGQERDKLMAESSSGRLTRIGFPVIEVSDTGSSSEPDPYRLQQRADALQAAHETPTDSWSVQAPIDGDPPLGVFRRGDVAKLEIRRKLLIPPGDYLRRITNVSGSATSPMVTIACDYEDQLA